MNALDFFVIGIIILSGLFAFARGFVRECLSIASWMGATAAALYGLPYLRPYAERFAPKGTVADAVAAGVAFLVTLVVLALVSGMVSRRVKRSSLSALDRTLGLLFGLARGVMLVAIGFLALSFVLPPGGEKPRWIAESRTAPLFLDATSSLARLLPPTVRQRVTAFNPKAPLNQEFEDALKAYVIPGAKAPPGGGLSAEDQARLNQLLERLASDPAAQRALKEKMGMAPAPQALPQGQ